MAPTPEKPKMPTEAEVASLRAENERLAAELAAAKKAATEASKAVMEDLKAEKSAEPMFRNAKGQMVPEKCRGTKTYLVGASGHYRNGKLYAAGEKITVTDEKPGKQWVLLEKSAQAPVSAPSQDSGSHPSV